MRPIVHAPVSSIRDHGLRLMYAALIASACVGVARAGSKPDDEDMRRALESYFSHCHAAAVCNGSYLVVREGRVLLDAAYGQADEHADNRLTTAHRFDIGSLSKQFTAAAIVQLAEKKKLDYDDPVVRHLPGFPYPDITLRQLLQHTSGLPDTSVHYSNMMRAGKVKDPILETDTTDILVAAKRPLAFAPGTRFQYSNTNYRLLADVIERASGMRYRHYLERNFFTPFKLAATTLRQPDNEATIRPRALGYRLSADRKAKPMDQFPLYFMRGAGGIYSTTADLQRWSDALQAGKVVSAASWKAMQEAPTLADGTQSPYGFGWGVKPSPLGNARIYHGGHWRAFKTDLAIYPTLGLTVIQLTNNGQDDSVDAARDAVEAIAAGRVPEAVKPPLQFDLLDRLRHGKAEDVRMLLAQERDPKTAKHAVDEDALNGLGYDLIARKRFDDAIAVLAFNRDMHPRSTNAYDSLADAYLAKGDKPAAAGELRALLSLKPDDEATRKKLLEIEGQP